MGAHTLGNADKEASGYRGAWIGGGTTDFNNVYYKYLTGEGVLFDNSVSLKNLLKNQSGEVVTAKNILK